MPGLEWGQGRKWSGSNVAGDHDATCCKLRTCVTVRSWAAPGWRGTLAKSDLVWSGSKGCAAEVPAPSSAARISALADDRWVAVNTIVGERLVRELLPRLSEAGAQGIVEYPLNKIVE